VDRYEGVTTDYFNKYNISVVLRGMRYVTDIHYERDFAINNKKIIQEIETLFLFSGTGTEVISAKWIKEIAFHDGDLKGLVPPLVQTKIKQRILKGERV